MCLSGTVWRPYTTTSWRRRLTCEYRSPSRRSACSVRRTLQPASTTTFCLRQSTTASTAVNSRRRSRRRCCCRRRRGGESQPMRNLSRFFRNKSCVVGTSCQGWRCFGLHVMATLLTAGSTVRLGRSHRCEPLRYNCRTSVVRVCTNLQRSLISSKGFALHAFTAIKQNKLFSACFILFYRTFARALNIQN